MLEQQSNIIVTFGNSISLGLKIEISNLLLMLYLKGEEPLWVLYISHYVKGHFCQSLPFTLLNMVPIDTHPSITLPVHRSSRGITSAFQPVTARRSFTRPLRRVPRWPVVYRFDCQIWPSKLYMHQNEISEMDYDNSNLWHQYFVQLCSNTYLVKSGLLISW